MKQRVFSGIQPSGLLTIGNYLGALKHFAKLQDEADCVFCVVDMHAITVPQKPQDLHDNSLRLAAVYLAAGIDPNKSTLFVQSHVPAHAELGWMLQCVAHFGELSRMTQFKDKSASKAVVTSGLFTYPALMAADILLYQTNYVPVGDDQKQHLELTRDIAIRFNQQFGETFVVPEPMIADVGGRIMSLEVPEKKMSKSDVNQNAFVALLDEPDAIRKKIARAVTDSEREVRFDPEAKPAISNLLTIYSLFSDQAIAAVEAQYQGQGYGPFKSDLAEVIVEGLRPIRERYQELVKSPELITILQDGAQRAAALSAPTIAKVKERFGFVR